MRTKATTRGIRPLVALLCLLTLTHPALGPARAQDNTLPRVPPGFAVSVFATVGGLPTSLDLGPSEGVGYGLAQSTLYVADFAGGRILAIDSTEGAPGPPREFASGFRNPLGVVVDDAGTVFVSDAEAPREGPFGTRSYGRVWRLRDKDGDGVADEKRIVLKDLPNGRHNTNGLALGPDGMLYVTNGNSTDDGIEGGEPEAVPWSGSVVRVDPKSTRVSLTDLNRGSALIATGMRNVYDLAFSPVDKSKLFLPTNGVDDARPGEGGENPTEEIEDSDDLLYATDVTDGRADDFGFPECLYNTERQGNLKPYQNPHPDVRKRFGRCPIRSVPRPLASFGLHVSADGLAFQTTGAWGKDFRNDLFVAEFGNFFGDEIVGHQVTRVELNRAGNLVVRQGEFLSGALPLDLTFDSQGAMYVADFSGVIYRITRVVELPKVVEVQINAFQFLPQKLVIPEGTTVRWVNRETLGMVHNVRGLAGVTPDGAGDGSRIDSKNLPVGNAHEFRFEEPGNYEYTCTINVLHTALMHGSITVVPAGN